LFFPDAPDGTLRLSPSQLMIEAYYQMMLAKGLFFQTALTEIPNPGQNEAIPNAFALTLRVIALF
jgi:carbohydrate-selective porin OprB